MASSIKLFADEDFPVPVLNILQDMGYDTLSTTRAGRALQSIPDPDQLQYALNDGYVMLTCNVKHYKQLHQDGAPHNGIVLCAQWQPPDYTDQARCIDDAIRNAKPLNGTTIIPVKRPRRNKP